MTMLIIIAFAVGRVALAANVFWNRSDPLINTIAVTSREKEQKEE